MQSNSFLKRHLTSIIIIVVAILLAAALLIWLEIIKKNIGAGGNNPNGSGLTEAQIQAIVSDVPKGPSMSNADRTAIMKEEASGTGAMTDAERAKILQQNTK